MTAPHAPYGQLVTGRDPTHMPFERAPDTYPRYPRLLAICGRKRSGKDTAARALRCFGFKPISFAEPLKQMLVAFLVTSGMDPDVARWNVYDGPRTDPLPELNGRTVRHALQTLGTEWGRDLIHYDVWRDSTMRAIAAAPERRFVITDLRFPNEADAIRAAGGLIIKIERDLPLDADDAHISENLLNDIMADYTIQNVYQSAEAFSVAVQAFYNRVISA